MSGTFTTSNIPLGGAGVVARGSIRAAVNGSLANEPDNGSTALFNGSSTILLFFASSELFTTFLFVDGNSIV